MWHKKGTHLFVFLLIIAALLGIPQIGSLWNPAMIQSTLSQYVEHADQSICLRHCATIHIWQTHPSVTHCKHYRFHHGWSSSRKSRMVCNGSTDLECKFSPSTRRFLSQSWGNCFWSERVKDSEQRCISLMCMTSSSILSSVENERRYVPVLFGINGIILDSNFLDNNK